MPQSPWRTGRKARPSARGGRTLTAPPNQPTGISSGAAAELDADAGERLPVIFINLDRATERRAFMERQAARLKVALERFAAVTPAAIGPAEARLAHTWERPLTPPEMALFLSHRALWRRAAESRDGIVILEDDCVLSCRFPAFLTLKPGRLFDLVNLESFNRRKFVRRIEPLRLGPFDLAPLARDKSGSAAYFVSPRGAERLLALAERRAAPSDAFLFTSGIESAQAEPAPAVQAHILKRLGIDAGLDSPTQIHAARARLPLTPANAAFHARRAGMQVALARLHLARLWTLDFRRPVIALDDFAQASREAPRQSDS